MHPESWNKYPDFTISPSWLLCSPTESFLVTLSVQGWEVAEGKCEQIYLCQTQSGLQIQVFSFHGIMDPHFETTIRHIFLPTPLKNHQIAVSKQILPIG